VAGFVVVQGTNTVLYLQTARFLMKCFTQAQKDDRLPDTVAYLKDTSPLTQRDWNNRDVQVKVYGERSKYAIRKAAERLQSLINEGQQESEAWDACAIQLVASAEAHYHYVVIAKCTEGMHKVICSEDDASNFHERKVLKMLSDLFVLSGIVKSPSGFLECGILTVDDLTTIRLKLLDLLKDQKQLHWSMHLTSQTN
jgi:acyl-CoA oxidase